MKVILAILLTGAILPASQDEPCIGVPAITTHEIAMVVRANRYRLQECYRTALKEKPKLTGKLNAQFELTDKGTQVRISSSTLDHPAFETCTLDALKKFRFPPLRYNIGQTVKVTYPFVFRLDNPDGRPVPVQVRYQAGETLAVAAQGSLVTVTLPDRAREVLLESNPGYRLLQSGDLASGNSPQPFAAVSDFDRKNGNDLAIALIHKKQRRLWRLVALHNHPKGYRSVLVTGFSQIESHFKHPTRRPSFWVTTQARCFCEHRCLAIASSIGRSFEFEFNGERYTGKLENYLPD